MAVATRGSATGTVHSRTRAGLSRACRRFQRAFSNRLAEAVDN
jgi:hypothetical protein